MSEYLVDETYADALFRLTQERGETEEVLQQLELAADVLRDQRDYLMLLQHPKLSAEEKKGMLEEVFGGKVKQTLLDFFMVLIDKRRFLSVPGITKRYRKIIEEDKQITRGVIVTAIPLSEEQHARAESELGQLIRKKVCLKNEVDSEILGGLVVYVEGQMIDGSVRSRLKTLGQQASHKYV